MKIYAWGNWNSRLNVYIDGINIFSWSPNNDLLSRYDDKNKYYYSYVRYTFIKNSIEQVVVRISASEKYSNDRSRSFGFSFMSMQ